VLADFLQKELPSTSRLGSYHGGTAFGRRPDFYCVIDSLASLIWAANLADLELHTFCIVPQV
jgi:DNA primase